MVSLMANGGGGQYDMVSASGDADLRLIYGGDVRPVNIGLIPYQSPSVEGIQRYIKAETEKWGALVRQLGLEGSQ